MRLPCWLRVITMGALALGACNVDFDDPKSDGGNEQDMDPASMKDAAPGDVRDGSVSSGDGDALDATMPPQPKSDAGPAPDATVDAAPPVACQEGSDECDDGDPCNGKESCVGGFCAAGSSPCPNPDPDHCSTLCLPAGGSVECKVLARDDDEDLHGDPLCTVIDEKGDDCDDQNASVHPGANEACDQIDNDCDGKVDLEDGVSLSTTSKKYVDAASKPDVTFLPTKVAYGVSFAKGTDLAFNQFDRGGERLFSLSTNLTNGASTSSIISTSIHWGGNELGIAWSRFSGLRFLRLSADGEPVEEASDPTPSGWMDFGGALALHRIDDQDWLLFFGCCMSRPGLSARRVAPDGTVREPLYKISDAARDQVRGAVSGDQLGLTFVHIENPMGASVARVRWTRRNAELGKLETDDGVITSTENLANAGNSAIAATADGYVISWFDGSTKVAEYDREGNVLCGPVDLTPSFHDPKFAFHPTDIAAGPEGYAIIGAGMVATNSYRVDVVHVKPGCKYVQRFMVGESTSAIAYANIASGGEHGFGAVWQESSTSGNTTYHSVYNRAMAPTFCKAP